MNWEEMVISTMYKMRVSPLIFQDEELDCAYAYNKY